MKMSTFVTFAHWFIFLSMISLARGATAENVFPCLPSERKLTDVVSAEVIGRDASGRFLVKRITIADKLIELKAHCDKEKLIDGMGKEIYFYQLTGCWGNPPVNYQEIMQRQRQAVESLKKKYSVIELTCNPEGIPIP